MLVGSSQSPLSVSGFRNDIFGPYDDKIFLFFSFAFLSIFVCATSGTNVNDIGRIDFKNFRYPLDEPDESDKTTWRWTRLSLQSKVLLIVLAKEHGVQIMTTPRTVSIPLLTPPSCCPRIQGIFPPILVPLTAIRGTEQRVSGGGTPNRCRETDSHATLRHSFFQAIGATRGALTAAHVPTGLSFFLLLFSFLVPIASFPQRNFAPGSPRNDDRKLGRPTTSPVLSLLMRISLSQSRSLPTFDCLPCCFICLLPQAAVPE